jgi:hypothetical protein
MKHIVSTASKLWNERTGKTNLYSDGSPSMRGFFISVYQVGKKNSFTRLTLLLHYIDHLPVTILFYYSMIYACSKVGRINGRYIACAAYFHLFR